MFSIVENFATRFEAFFKKDLAKRLLFQRSVCLEVEHYATSLLREECGSAYTAGSSTALRAINFSRMRSEGSRFTLGVWGPGCVRPMLRLRSQPFANARMHLEWSRKCVKLTRDAAVILAFAEEVSV